MEISEKELENYLFDNYKTIEFLNGDYIIRQMNLVGYGILDLLVIETIGSIIKIKIVELKKNEINFETVGQASRYYTGIKRSLESLPFFINSDYSFIYELILVGNSVSNTGSFEFFLNLIDDRALDIQIKIITYEVSLKYGVLLEVEGGEWYRVNEKTNYKLEKYIKKALTNKEYENINKNAIRPSDSKGDRRGGSNIIF